MSHSLCPHCLAKKLSQLTTVENIPAHHSLSSSLCPHRTPKGANPRNPLGTVPCTLGKLLRSPLSLTKAIVPRWALSTIESWSSAQERASASSEAGWRDRPEFKVCNASRWRRAFQGAKAGEAIFQLWAKSGRQRVGSALRCRGGIGNCTGHRHLWRSKPGASSRPRRLRNGSRGKGASIVVGLSRAIRAPRSSADEYWRSRMVLTSCALVSTTCTKAHPTKGSTPPECLRGAVVLWS